jgi:hypothetical protein
MSNLGVRTTNQGASSSPGDMSGSADAKPESSGNMPWSTSNVRGPPQAAIMILDFGHWMHT